MSISRATDFQKLSSISSYLKAGRVLSFIVQGKKTCLCLFKFPGSCLYYLLTDIT